MRGDFRPDGLHFRPGRFCRFFLSACRLFFIFLLVTVFSRTVQKFVVFNRGTISYGPRRTLNFQNFIFLNVLYDRFYKVFHIYLFEVCTATQSLITANYNYFTNNDAHCT